PTYSILFFFNDTSTTEIYTLSLHDALPISRPRPTLVAWRVWKAFPFERNYLMIFLFVIQFRFASLSDMTKVVSRCLFASPGGRRRTAMAWHFLLPESFLAKN